MNNVKKAEIQPKSSTNQIFTTTDRQKQGTKKNMRILLIYIESPMLWGQPHHLLLLMQQPSISFQYILLENFEVS